MATGRPPTNGIVSFSRQRYRVCISVAHSAKLKGTKAQMRDSWDQITQKRDVDDASLRRKQMARIVVIPAIEADVVADESKRILDLCGVNKDESSKPNWFELAVIALLASVIVLMVFT